MDWQQKKNAIGKTGIFFFGICCKIYSASYSSSLHTHCVFPRVCEAFFCVYKSICFQNTPIFHKLIFSLFIQIFFNSFSKQDYNFCCCCYCYCVLVQCKCVCILHWSCCLCICIGVCFIIREIFFFFWTCFMEIFLLWGRQFF